MYKARECLSEVCAIFLEIFVLIRYFQSQYWCLPNLETWRSTSLESEVFPKTTPYSVAQSCLPQKAHTATTDQPLSPTALINRDGCTGREGTNGVCQQKNWMEGSEGSRSGLLCQAFQLPWTPQPTPKISKAHTLKSNRIQSCKASISWISWRNVIWMLLSAWPSEVTWRCLTLRY